MIHLFSDFGQQGPYIGEMQAVLARGLPNITLIDLMHDAPAFNPRASAYLLAALSRRFMPGDMCLAVVDPGVGNKQRRVLLLEADEVCYVGPDNGLFAVLLQGAQHCLCREICWRPDKLSSSFHGRDLFAPVAIRNKLGLDLDGRMLEPGSLVGMDWPQQIAEVVYIDRYGNVVTGLRATDCSKETDFTISGRKISHALIFSAVETGVVFWYENSMGLVEIAVNSGNAADILGLRIGSTVFKNA